MMETVTDPELHRLARSLVEYAEGLLEGCAPLEVADAAVWACLELTARRVGRIESIEYLRIAADVIERRVLDEVANKTRTH